MGKKTDFENNFSDLTDEDYRAIAQLISERYTSGHLVEEDRRIYFELKVNVWKD